MRAARAWHLLTAFVAATALVLQLVLVIRGGRVLEEAHAPSMTLRLLRFVAYFTIQSNVLVLVSTAALARDPGRCRGGLRVVRTAAMTGIIVTGLVHWFLLRPLLHLHGADLVADKLLHLVVPLLALAGWLVFGPRPVMIAAIEPAGDDLAPGLAARRPGAGSDDRVVPLPVPRPPRARLGPRGGGLCRDLRAVVRPAPRATLLRPADGARPARRARDHW